MAQQSASVHPMIPRFSALLLCATILPVVTADVGRPKAVSTPVPLSAEAAPEKSLQLIREFDLATLGRIGREIYRHDQIAWHGTDAVFEQVGQAKMTEERCCGWVVDTSGDEPLLRFVRKTGEGEEAAYDVRFPKDGKPVVSTPENRALTEHQKASRRAFSVATMGFAEKRMPICRCRGSYNFVVLDDPTGPGFLVYLLRPKDEDAVIPVGGHYRISVSADGRTVMQIDRLWRTCMTLDKRDGLPAGAEMVAASMSHVVSPSPLETHVFLSLQEKLPFYVITNDGRTWRVADGAIELADMEKDPAAKAKPAE